MCLGICLTCVLQGALGLSSGFPAFVMKMEKRGRSEGRGKGEGRTSKIWQEQGEQGIGEGAESQGLQSRAGGGLERRGESRKDTEEALAKGP